MAKNRDAKYYVDRLRRDFAAIYSDLKSAKYPSVRAASAAAGLIHLPTRVDALKREWKKSTERDQADFLCWVKTTLPRGGHTGKGQIVDPSGRLLPHVVKFISVWRTANRSKAGRIMKELGFSGYDWRLANAVDHSGVLRTEVTDKLKPWLLKNGL
jgi:hypothetical protein